MVKRLMIIEELKNSLEHIDSLIKASKGDKNGCSCKEFKDIGLYVKFWIKYPIEKVLKEFDDKYKSEVI